MEVAKIEVSGTRARTVYANPITAGMIGAEVAVVYTDPVWDGLAKTVVFYGAGTKDVVTQDQFVTIPAEVIAQDHVRLQVGIYGTDAESVLAIPTLWADLGTVKPGADPSGDTTTDPALPVWAQIQGMIGNLNDLDTAAKNNLVAAVNEALRKGGGTVDAAEIQRIVDAYLAANPPTVTETDPTVPAWAKQPQKPTYTAAEVRALPDTYTPPNQTAQQVGADPAGTAASAVSQHNTDTAAHNDLRLALQRLSDRINAALDSDDTTLDQMSEVVAYIKSNKILIDAITTSKVSVADIVNDLATNVADKPLSAAQGVALKKLIDDLQAMIPSEGGSGISVSGATVGQTVRITAVDDDGVPTAWETVDWPSVGTGSTKWEPILNEVWSRNREFKFIEYDADTLTYTFPDGTFGDDEIGTAINTSIVIDPNSMPDTYGEGQSTLTPISGNQATIASAQHSALDGKNYWFEIPTALSIKGINARKIRVRWDGNVENTFQNLYHPFFAYGMPVSQAASYYGYFHMRIARSIADIELELVDPYIVSGKQNAYVFGSASNPGYNKKWYQSYSPVMTDVSKTINKEYAYSSDGLKFENLYFLQTPWLGDKSVKFFIGNGTRIYVAREV